MYASFSFISVHAMYISDVKIVCQQRFGCHIVTSFLHPTRVQNFVVSRVAISLNPRLRSKTITTDRNNRTGKKPQRFNRSKSQADKFYGKLVSRSLRERLDLQFKTDLKTALLERRLNASSGNSSAIVETKSKIFVIFFAFSFLTFLKRFWKNRTVSLK